MSARCAINGSKTTWLSLVPTRSSWCFPVRQPRTIRRFSAWWLPTRLALRSRGKLCSRWKRVAAVTGEVVPSTWSKTLPFTYLITGSSSVGKPVDRFAGVGAVSGSIYYLNKSDNRLDQYQPDGTLVRQLVLPQSTAGSKGNIEQLAVVEDPTTNEIWIALARSTSVWINTNLTGGWLHCALHGAIASNLVPVGHRYARGTGTRRRRQALFLGLAY